MRKLANISAFESLCCNSYGAVSDVSVFNAIEDYFRDRVVGEDWTPQELKLLESAYKYDPDTKKFMLLNRSCAKLLSRVVSGKKLEQLANDLNDSLVDDVLRMISPQRQLDRHFYATHCQLPNSYEEREEMFWDHFQKLGAWGASDHDDLSRRRKSQEFDYGLYPWCDENSNDLKFRNKLLKYSDRFQTNPVREIPVDYF